MNPLDPHNPQNEAAKPLTREVLAAMRLRPSDELCAFVKEYGHARSVLASTQGHTDLMNVIHRTAAVAEDVLCSAIAILEQERDLWRSVAGDALGNGLHATLEMRDAVPT
jgi:hypothetical protein